MTILEDLGVTAEITGAMLSEVAAAIFVRELEAYDEQTVHEALARCRRELSGRLTLAAIIERLDDGRPGAEEAWAMVPKSEADSAIISSDMRVAMAPALELLAQGDHVAARMAFVEVYRKRVAIARAEHEPLGWTVSLGTDLSGRAAALIDGYRRKRISSMQALLAAGSVAEYVSAAIADDGPKAITGPAEVQPEEVAALAKGVAASLPRLQNRVPSLAGYDWSDENPPPNIDAITEITHEIEEQSNGPADEKRERYP